MSNRLTQLQEFLAQSPDDAFLQYAIAIEHISAGNDSAAEELFTRLLTQHPSYSATYYHFGKLLERKGEKEKAMDIYRQGIAVSKSNKEQNATAELQSALLELEYGD